MAEILGILSFCLGSINVILSTIPTGVKVSRAFLDCREQIRGLRGRLALCESQFSLLKTSWRDLTPADDATLLASSVQDIQDLHSKISAAIADHTTHSNKASTRRKIEERLSCGIFRKPRVESQKFWPATKFSLWDKEILDGWITRLEKALDVNEKLFERDYHRRTAEKFPGKPGAIEKAELRKLESFIGKLWSLANHVHAEGQDARKTYAWALDLQAPAVGKDVSNWKETPPVNIELRYSVDKRPEANECFRLRVRYQLDNVETHNPDGAIVRLVQTDALERVTFDPTFPAAKRYIQHQAMRSTWPLGVLLKTQPQLFGEMATAWLVDRSELVRGICHWALLLWRTPWVERLCCYGLLGEKNPDSSDRIKPVFDVKEHHPHHCQPGDHHSQLRNLGLVLAQLILGQSIQPARDGDLLKYELCANGNTEFVYRNEIVDKIGDVTSIPVKGAINFCLEPEPLLPNNQFEPGYLFLCIEKIYEPSVIKCQSGIHCTVTDMLSVSTHGTKSNSQRANAWK
jgi:hypothetical protein